MTSPIDFTGTMPMQWIFDVDPTQMDVSQRLPLKLNQMEVV